MDGVFSVFDKVRTEAVSPRRVGCNPGRPLNWRGHSEGTREGSSEVWRGSTWHGRLVMEMQIGAALFDLPWPKVLKGGTCS